jgi:hypothetical protein
VRQIRSPPVPRASERERERERAAKGAKKERKNEKNEDGGRFFASKREAEKSSFERVRLTDLTFILKPQVLFLAPQLTPFLFPRPGQNISSAARLLSCGTIL